MTKLSCSRIKDLKIMKKKYPLAHEILKLQLAGLYKQKEYKWANWLIKDTMKNQKLIEKYY